MIQKYFVWRYPPRLMEIYNLLISRIVFFPPQYYQEYLLLKVVIIASNTQTKVKQYISTDLSIPDI